MMKELYKDAERIKQIANDVRRGREMELWFDKACTIVTDECKIWPFALINGYGTLNKKFKRPVHVVSAIKAKGQIPINCEVSHGPCHNRACFNDKHLEYKTHKDNMEDMLRDGTDLRGEKHPNSKLTDEQVLQIKEKLNKTFLKQSEIARLFQVSKTVISAIKNDKRY